MAGMKHVFPPETGNREERGGGRGGGGHSRGSLETQICTPSREFVPSLGTHFRSNDYLGDLIQVSFHLTLPCILSTWKIGWLLVFTNLGQKNIGPAFVLAGCWFLQIWVKRILAGCLSWPFQPFPRQVRRSPPPGLDLKSL